MVGTARRARLCPPYAQAFWRSVTCASLLLDAGIPDQFFPQHELIADETAELFRRARERIHAERCELRLDLGLFHDLADSPVEPPHDLLAHIAPPPKAPPPRHI